jgi:hypothetical protein
MIEHRGGRAPRRKGDRIERQLVRLLQDHAIAAERIPLSGSVGGSWRGDLNIPLLGRDLRAEVKARGTGFSQLYKWIAGFDLLIIRRDRSEPLVIAPMRLAVEIARAAEKAPR